MAALNPSVQERVEREVKAYDQGEVFARSLRLQTRFQHRDSARGRSDRPVFVPHAAPLLDAAGRPGLDEDEGLRRPGNPAPARTVRINLTAASRQRIQSGATLLADRLRLRRRSRQRNAIAKALAHDGGAVVSALEPASPESRLPKVAPNAAATASRSSPPPGASVATLPPASAPRSIASMEPVQVRIVGTAVIVPLSSTGKR